MVKLSGLPWLLLAGCAQVLGTGNYEPCEEGECGGAGAGQSGGNGSGADSSSGGCFDLTITVDPQVEVKLETAQDLDFGAGTTTQCVNAGQVVLEARCADGELKGDSVSVDWGNPECTPGPSCDFTLSEDTTLVVTATAGACPSGD